MKKIRLTLEDIFNIPGAVIYNPDDYKPVTAVTIDSRNVQVNSLFIAIKGDKFDGHDFVEGAVKDGAAAVMVDEKKYKRFENLEIPLITVEDTTAALGDIAKAWRKKLSAKIIGITGSAGKTSTKEMLFSLLSEKYKVNKTIANNNNHIGVPLTILSTNAKHEILLLELGTNHFGEIDYTSDISQPDFALITNIGSSHLEFLKDRKGVFKEKIALFRITVEKQGVLFINNDDDLLKNSFNNYNKKISFGYNSTSDVKGKISGFSDEGKPIIEISYKKNHLKEIFPLYGEQNAKNFLASAAVAFKLGLSAKEIKSGLKKLKPVSKRLDVKKYNNALLIDDTYNANPESMKAALNLLSRIKVFKRKIAVLGDMFELGNESEKYHKQLASEVKKNKIDEVYSTGSMMKLMNDSIKDSIIEKKHFSSRKKLADFLSKKDFTGSAILVKGSRGMRMEEFVQVIQKNI